MSARAFPGWRRAPGAATLLAPLALALAGCGDEAILRRLDERQANQVLVALGDSGVAARKEPDGREEGSFAVTVRGSQANEALGLLASRDLPRPRAPGFSELFGSPGLVPTPLEEQARFLHAVSGELSRTLEGLDGVLAARVHLALPAPDPLRPEARRSPRASVLLRCRPGARARLEAQAEGLRRMVAGAADGLEPMSVALLVSEAETAPPTGARDGHRRRAALALAALLLATLLGAVAVAVGRRRASR